METLDSTSEAEAGLEEAESAELRLLIPFFLLTGLSLTALGASIAWVPFYGLLAPGVGLLGLACLGAALSQNRLAVLVLAFGVVVLAGFVALQAAGHGLEVTLARNRGIWPLPALPAALIAQWVALACAATLVVSMGRRISLGLAIVVWTGFLSLGPLTYACVMALARMRVPFGA